MTEQIINSKQSLDAYKAFLDIQFSKKHYLRMTCKTGDILTSLQRSSLHLFCRQVADALNDAGYDMVQVLSEGTNIPWTDSSVKNFIWRKVQLSMTDKVSTTKLKTNEVSQIYDVINRYLGEKFGIFVPWPCKENMK